jgi:hypothetical protein
MCYFNLPINLTHHYLQNIYLWIYNRECSAMGVLPVWTRLLVRSRLASQKQSTPSRLGCSSIRPAAAPFPIVPRTHSRRALPPTALHPMAARTAPHPSWANDSGRASNGAGVAATGPLPMGASLAMSRHWRIAEGPRCCYNGELYAPPPTSALASSSAMMTIHLSQ